MERDLSDWQPRALPGGKVLAGYGVRLEPFEAGHHGEDLYAAVGGRANDHLWRWLPVGPFPDAGSMAAFFTAKAEAGEWIPMVIFREGEDRPLGTFSFMRLRPADGGLEIGCVIYGPELARTRAATAAFCLSARHVFDDLGYRRYEWKCNSLNEASGRAALRYGFFYEGRFRQDRVDKGRNRDSNWYSIIDGEWPARRQALEAWLAPENFDPAGCQRRSLLDCHAGADPAFQA